MRAVAVLPVLPVLALVGCGLSYQIDPELLRQISMEQRLLLFEAENDLSIAIDERDKVRRSLLAQKRDLRDTNMQISEAHNDEERASQKGEEERRKLAELAADVFDLKRDYILANIDALRERLQVQDVVIIAARAQFELAKAKLVVENNVRGASSVDMEDFEDQVAATLENARDALNDFAETQAEVDELRKIWLAQRASLNKATGGGLGSPWAEEGGFSERARTIRALENRIRWRTD